MKRLFVLLLFPVLAHAGSLSMEMQQSRVVDLARIAYGQIAKRPYIVTDAALKSNALATLSFSRMHRDQAVASVVALLKASGFSVEDRAGVVWIDVAHPDVHEFFYKPKYRPVSYLLDLLQAVFPQGSFTQQRGVPNLQSQQVGQGALPPASAFNQSQPQQPQPVDNGTSAFSLIDKSPDAFMFRGSDADIKRLQGLLAQVDVPTPELFVKAVVYEVTTSSDDKSAMSLAFNILKGRLQLNDVTPGAFSGVFKVGRLEAVIDALSTDSRFKVVSTPTLRVRSGANARLTVGTQTPVLGATVLTGNGTSSQSVDYKPSGVILDLRPEVRDEVADLRITQQISSFVQTTTGVNSSPTLQTRELSTQVAVKDGDVLVLGGLDETKDSEASQGLSFLPSFLSADTHSSDRTQVLIVLQATRI